MNHLYCGVDIAKDNAVFCLVSEQGQLSDKAISFPNTTQGFKAALKWLRRLAKPYKPFDVHLAVEATGVYYLFLAKFFHRQKGITVSVLNPAQVKSFAQAELIRTKTDSVDAMLITRFTMALKPRPWTPPLPHEEEMLGIIRHIDALKDMAQAEKSRLHALEHIGPSTANIQKTIKQHLKFLKEQIDELNNKLRDLVKKHPDIDQNVKLLCSIPGVGEITAHTLLAEIGDMNRFENVKKLVAYAGLAPAERQSGTSIKGKSMINKRGSARLRSALYMPAIVAARCNPDVKNLYQRLIAAGKKPICAIVACMRKILHIAYGVLKHKQFFEPKCTISA